MINSFALSVFRVGEKLVEYEALIDYVMSLCITRWIELNVTIDVARAHDESTERNAEGRCHYNQIEGISEKSSKIIRKVFWMKLWQVKHHHPVISHANSLTPSGHLRASFVRCLCKSLACKQSADSRKLTKTAAVFGKQPEVVGGNLQIHRTKSASRAVSWWLAFTFCCSHKDFSTQFTNEWMNPVENELQAAPLTKRTFYASQWLTQ